MGKAAHGFLFACDPEKNVACKKSGCHIFGGPCKHTKYMKYAKNPDKVIMVVSTDAKTLGKDESDDNN